MWVGSRSDAALSITLDHLDFSSLEWLQDLKICEASGFFELSLGRFNYAGESS